MEDVPDVLEKIHNAEKIKKINSDNNETGTDKETTALMSESPPKKDCSIQKQVNQQTSTSFCGMKKGFLFGAPSKVRNIPIFCLHLFIIK